MGKGFHLSAGSVMAMLFAVFLEVSAAPAPRPAPEQIRALEAAIRADDENATVAALERNAELAHEVVFQTRRPLIVAAARGWERVVDLLLRQGADMNATGDPWDTANSRRTALQVAVWYNRPSICKRLLLAGANPNLLSSSGGSALHMAFPYQREEIAALLLDAGADPFLEGGGSYRRATPFELAVGHTSGRLVPRMLNLESFRSGASRVLAARGPELLRIAAQRGELEAAEALVKAGVSTQAKTPEGFLLLQAMALSLPTAVGIEVTFDRRNRIRTLLEQHGAEYDAFAATGFGDLETLQRLVATNPALAHIRDPEGQTPLHWAVRADLLPLTSFWLEVGALPSATNAAGQTALHLGASRGLTAQVERLLAANAPTDLRDTNGWTAFDAAARAKQPGTIRLLMSGRDSSAAGERGAALPIHQAAADGNLVALSGLLIPSSVQARNELGLTPLQIAIQRGQFGAAALLLDNGAEVDARDPEGNTALHLAIRNTRHTAGKPPAAWLERAGLEPPKKSLLRYFDETEEEEAVHRAMFQAVGLLLARGADASATNRAGQSVLQLVLDESTFLFGEDRPRLAQLLASAGANVNQADTDGNTELHRLGADVSADRVAALVAGGASVNATNRDGQTPLHLFAQRMVAWDRDGTGEPFQLLLKSGADVNAQDKEGLTPLHVLALADTSFKARATGALLKAGANPSLSDHRGRTPVHCFLSGEWPWREAAECVGLLARAGANLAAADDRGRTPLHSLAALGGPGRGAGLLVREVGMTFVAAQMDFVARDREGNTPLHLAAKSGAADVFEWLAKQGNALDLTNNAGETPRMLALQSTNRFSQFRFSPSEDIFNAAWKGDAEVVTRSGVAPKCLTLDSGGRGGEGAGHGTTVEDPGGGRVVSRGGAGEQPAADLSGGPGSGAVSGAGGGVAGPIPDGGARVCVDGQPLSPGRADAGGQPERRGAVAQRELQRVVQLAAPALGARVSGPLQVRAGSGRVVVGEAGALRAFEPGAGGATGYGQSGGCPATNGGCGGSRPGVGETAPGGVEGASVEFLAGVFGGGGGAEVVDDVHGGVELRGARASGVPGGVEGVHGRPGARRVCGQSVEGVGWGSGAGRGVLCPGFIEGGEVGPGGADRGETVGGEGFLGPDRGGSRGGAGAAVEGATGGVR